MKKENIKGININPLTSLRPTIVTVLGHVDHGKTTLLDKIRNSSIAEREAGGITQKIGATLVETKGGKVITFIDTPGHAAFSNMRLKGTKVADIVVLVIAADDGVYPQTKEAISYIKQASIPFIVAVTKIDLPSANVEMVKEQLEKEGIILEKKGGDIPLVEISSKKGVGVEELLEVLGVLADVVGIKGSPDDNLEAYVFETGKDRGGPYASLVIKKGTLRVGDEIVTENVEGKVRGIFNDKGKQVKEVLPGYPCSVIGFTKLPHVGSQVWKKDSKSSLAFSQDNKSVIPKVSEGELPIIVKAKSAGSLEAVVSNIPPKVVVIESSIGDVIENDVFLAKSAFADIYAFESGVPTNVKKIAESESVRIFSFDIIYKLFEKLEEELVKDKTEVLGEAEVVQIFPFNKKRVAGSKVVKGKIGKNDNIIIRRGDREVGKVKIVTLKKNKQDVLEVKQGEEFGVIFTPQLEFAIGDMLISLK